MTLNAWQMRAIYSKSRDKKKCCSFSKEDTELRSISISMRFRLLAGALLTMGCIKCFIKVFFFHTKKICWCTQKFHLNNVSAIVFPFYKKMFVLTIKRNVEFARKSSSFLLSQRRFFYDECTSKWTV